MTDPQEQPHDEAGDSPSTPKGFRFVKVLLFCLFALTDIFIGVSIISVSAQSNFSPPVFFMSGVFILGQMVYFINEIIQLHRSK
jgi:hypothetical protein